MQEWYALATRLVLGSDANATPFTTDDPTLAHFFRQLPAGSPSRQLVLALAGLQWMRKLGQSFTHETTEISATPEIQPIASATTIDILQKALLARQHALLSEALRLMQHHQQLLPPELLVDCFTLAEKSSPLQTLVIAVAGKRGEWLARQNPAWQVATTDTTNGNALVALLSEQPAGDGDSFLQTLISLWNTLTAKDRQKVLTQLEQTPPRPSSLPFLQKCQQDRSQSVRLSIARQRARLLDASLLHMALNVITPSLCIERRGLLRHAEFEVRLPASFDKAWEVVGIQENLEQIAIAGKLGKKSAWLHQWLSLVSGNDLVTALDTTSEEYLSLAGQSDYADALYSAWAHSALLHNDLPALQTLIKQLPETRTTRWLRELMPMAQGHCRDELLTFAVAPPSGTLALPLADILGFSMAGGPHSEPVSNALLDHLTRNNESNYYHNSGTSQRFDLLAFYVPVTLLPQWITRLEARNNPALESCLRWLRIRQQLHQEFQS